MQGPLPAGRSPICVPRIFRRSTKCSARKCAASSSPRSSRRRWPGKSRGTYRARCCAAWASLGFLGIRYPARYGGSEMDTLATRRARRRARPLDVYRRRHHGPRCTPTWPRCTVFKSGTRSAEGHMDAAHHRRRGHHRGRGDRAGCRLRREGHPHFRAARRRQLRAQRHQDVHHQRRLRRSLLRRRQDRPAHVRSQPLGDHVPGREGHAGLQGQPRARQARLALLRHGGARFRRTAAFPPRTCSARKAAASMRS